MLLKAIIVVSSENHIKYINTLCVQNVGILNVEPGGTVVCSEKLINEIASFYGSQ